MSGSLQARDVHLAVTLTRVSVADLEENTPARGPG